MSLTLQSFLNPIRIDATGVARIGDTRVTLETVIHKFHGGDAPEEIADAYRLDLAQIYATITYYLQHRAQVDEYLRATEAEEGRVARIIVERSNPTALRRKLLARLVTAAKPN
jgi:uncharacterized protein (DUF433 family)